MPTIVIHEEIAIHLAKLDKSLDTKEFYLGILAPDAPNINGFAEKSKRWDAHLRSKDLREWRGNLKRFYHQEKEHYPKNFLIGYIIHILTDIIFDEYFYLPIKNNMLQDKISKEEYHEKMREDMDHYGSKSPWLTKRNILKEPINYYDIRNINKELLKSWTQKKLTEEFEPIQSKYITSSVIEKLTMKVGQEYKELIKE